MSTYTPQDLITLVGQPSWLSRIEHVRLQVNQGGRTGQFAAQRYAAECAIEKARRGQPLTPGETAYVELATRLPALHDELTNQGRDRLAQSLDAALSGAGTIIPLLHMLYTAELQKNRGFEVAYAGLAEAAPFDLLISRDGAEAEVVCDTISAEDGHAVHRGAWMQLIDRVDPDLQTWLSAHPGRYLLKMTLPKGLKAPGETELPALHRRITEMLSNARRADYDEAAILRLDPLLLAGAQATDRFQGGMMAKLRQEYGPEAHLAMTAAGNSMFVMAARASTENDVARMVRHRLAALAPSRLTGTRPGIIAMFIDDTDHLEWRILREKLVLEAETRQFLTFPEAKTVVAVTCASRFELTGAEPHAVPGGDLRFRNAQHPAAKSVALAPAVLSTV